ncbi:spermidine/putrescine ABC transporter substrate-binding protein [Intrasporangium sp.]|uniref:polyamine ABC transporter substrate-binding protein n=1 Tax=Intrasporangium sp. TaxID=1925024 RepID=UPI003221EFC9
MTHQSSLARRAAFARGALSRRRVLGGLAGALAAGTLAACGSPPQSRRSGSGATPTARAAATDRSDVDRIVRWSNWPEYIDVDEQTGRRPSIDAFTKQTGIAVEYTEDYNDNAEFYAKVRPALAAGHDTGRDVWVSSDWMVGRLIGQGFVQPLEMANIPNARNLDPALRAAAFDPDRVYSLPWQSGFTCVAYNPRATGGRKVESVDQLLNDPALKGRVTLLSEMQDTIPMVMIDMGIDPATFTADQFEQACQVVEDAVARGQIKSFTGNDYTKPLVTGDTAACLAWSGDIVQLLADNPDLGWVLPQKGFLLWSDNFVIPALAQHKKNAERLINHYYDPAMMAKVVEYVNYVSPVPSAKGRLSDPEIGSNELIFPSEQLLTRAHDVRLMPLAEETEFMRRFSAIVNG